MPLFFDLSSFWFPAMIDKDLAYLNTAHLLSIQLSAILDALSPFSNSNQCFAYLFYVYSTMQTSVHSSDYKMLISATLPSLQRSSLLPPTTSATVISTST